MEKCIKLWSVQEISQSPFWGNAILGVWMLRMESEKKKGEDVTIIKDDFAIKYCYDDHLLEKKKSF